MSYSLGLYKFSEGELVEPDMDMVRAFLSPYSAASEQTADDDTEFWIRTADGSEAEVAVFEGVICIERPQVGDVWKMIIELANRVGAGVLDPDGTFLCREEMRAHLPEGMDDHSVFVPEITLEVFERVVGPFNHPLT